MIVKNNGMFQIRQFFKDKVAMTLRDPHYTKLNQKMCYNLDLDIIKTQNSIKYAYQYEAILSSDFIYLR